jgi:hypothetical protein
MRKLSLVRQAWSLLTGTPKSEIRRFHQRCEDNGSKGVALAKEEGRRSPLAVRPAEPFTRVGKLNKDGDFEAKYYVAVDSAQFHYAHPEGEYLDGFVSECVGRG